MGARFPDSDKEDTDPTLDDVCRADRAGRISQCYVIEVSQPQFICLIEHALMQEGYHILDSKLERKDGAEGEQSDDNDSSRITIRNLPDPLGRYKPLEQQDVYNSYEMVWPPVPDADGKHIWPGNYEDSIPDGTLVKVSGNLRMYNIATRGKPNIQTISDLMNDPGNPLKRPLEADNSTKACPSSNRKTTQLEYMDE